MFILSYENNCVSQVGGQYTLRMFMADWLKSTCNFHRKSVSMTFIEQFFFTIKVSWLGAIFDSHDLWYIGQSEIESTTVITKYGKVLIKDVRECCLQSMTVKQKLLNKAQCEISCSMTVQN